MLNETSYHGSGAIKAIPDEIKARGYKKAFICSDMNCMNKDRRIGSSQHLSLRIRNILMYFKLWFDARLPWKSQ